MSNISTLGTMISLDAWPLMATVFSKAILGRVGYVRFAFIEAVACAAVEQRFFKTYCQNRHERLTRTLRTNFVATATTLAWFKLAVTSAWLPLARRDLPWLAPATVVVLVTLPILLKSLLWSKWIGPWVWPRVVVAHVTAKITVACVCRFLMAGIGWLWDRYLYAWMQPVRIAYKIFDPYFTTLGIVSALVLLYAFWCPLRQHRNAEEPFKESTP